MDFTYSECKIERKIYLSFIEMLMRTQKLFKLIVY